MVSEGTPSERLGCPRLLGRRSMRCSKGPLTWPCDRGRALCAEVAPRGRITSGCLRVKQCYKGVWSEACGCTHRRRTPQCSETDEGPTHHVRHSDAGNGLKDRASHAPKRGLNGSDPVTGPERRARNDLPAVPRTSS